MRTPLLALVLISLGVFLPGSPAAAQPDPPPPAPVAAQPAPAAQPAATAGSAASAAPVKDWTGRSVGVMKWVPSSNLWLMEHEVTQAQWQAVMGSNPVVSSTKLQGGVDKGSCSTGGVGPTRPVACVSWAQAVEFAARVSARDGVTYRLPTEQEWEAAARGGEVFQYAGSDNLDTVGWYDGNTNISQPVCQKQRNAFGLCDMSGNVWEWTATEEGANRVARGGGWSLSPPRAKVDSRYAFGESDRYFNLGLRLARSGG